MDTVKEDINKKDVDQRYLPRWGTHLQALCRGSDDTESLKVVVKNLSCAGVCLSMDRMYHQNEILKLAIRFHCGTVIQLKGLVCWSREMKGDKLVGIHFDNLRGADQDTLLRNILGEEGESLSNYWFRDCT